MIKSRLNTVEFINPSFWFPCQEPCMGSYICNPTINLKLLGFLGVLLLQPVHERWLNNDHDWDSAQRNNTVPMNYPLVCCLNHQSSLIDTFVVYTHYIKLLWKHLCSPLEMETLTSILQYYLNYNNSNISAHHWLQTRTCAMWFIYITHSLFADEKTETVWA